MTPKGHLSANHFIGKRKQLSQLQTEYAIAMEPLGLSSGIEGSRAKHERIQAYYERVDTSVSPASTTEELESHSVEVPAAD